MTFDYLSPELREVLGARGLTEPTAPQRDAGPRIARGDNVLLLAPTGIGKTEAAMLPILDAMREEGKHPGIRCLYITPLRALNRDMFRRLEDIGGNLGISVDVRHGDTSASDRNRQSLHPPDVLITTPETLQVMFTGKRLAQHMKNIRWVVVDEIHELADTERGAQLSVALERLVMLAGEFQRIGLSATVGNGEEVARFLAGVKRRVTLCRHDTHRDMDISVERPDPCDDPVLLDRLQGDPDIISVMVRARQLIEEGRSTLFFVNTRETAEWLAARFRHWDPEFPIDVHHGSLSKEVRTEMEDRFKSGRLKALICTSSLELGIDVGTTDLVIQYNSPRRVARMVQRAGRAGHRIGGRIAAKVIATAPDELMEAMAVARRCEDREVEDSSGRPCPLTVVANQLVAMTMSGRMDRDSAYAVFRRAHPFRDLKREDMDGVLDQLKGIKMLFEDEDGFRRSRKGMDYFYSNISMIPDERSYFIRDIATRAVIGTLDESFVATFEGQNAMFIAKGRTWRVVEMREDEILVEEARDIGSVPSWSGSDIPVPFEVAMEVGRMRRTGDLSAYRCNGNAAAEVRRYIDEQREKWKANAESEIARLQGLMQTLTAEIDAAQGELKSRNEELYQAQLGINNLENSIKMAEERINIWTENFQDASIRLRSADDRIAGIQSSIDRLRGEIESLEDSLALKQDQADEELRQIAAMTKMQEEKRVRITQLEEEIEKREERSVALDEELLHLTEELKSVIEDLVAEVDENTDTAYSGERRDKAAKAFLSKAEEVKGVVTNRISFLGTLKADALISREIAEKDFSVFRSSVDELVTLFDEYRASIPPIVDSLLSSDGLIARKRDIEKREGEIRKESQANRTAIQLCRDETAVLRHDVDSLSETIDQQKEHYRSVLSNLDIAKSSLQAVRTSIEEKENEAETARLDSEKDRNLVQEYNDRIKAEDESRRQMKAELQEKSRETEAERSVVADMTAALQKKRSDKEAAYSDLNEANRILSEQNANIGSTDTLIENVVQSFFAKYSRNLGEFQKIIEEEDLPDDTLLMNELSEVNRELEKLGTVNYLAEDEYNAAKEQFDFYAKHLEDLNKARTDLEKVLVEIQNRAKELFLKTYNEISDNFQAMFTRLFGGGVAKLTLEDPENVLTSGIDIFAQPPGKKLVTLSLLSGGERSMTAVALLFATYQVKPSPFCILDELDAALDDKNIGYFLDVLVDFGKTSQFIIITHNKHTVTGSETLLGVTQMEAGVSTTVSYRLDRIAGKPVILNDDDNVVDFDSDGKLQ